MPQLEDVGRTPGGEVLRNFLAVSHNDDGTLSQAGIGANVAPLPSGDGTGATDSARLQAAINTTPAGGTLYIPAGIYTLNTGLTAQGISVVGTTGSLGAVQTQGTQLVAASGAVAGANNALFSVAPGTLTTSTNIWNIGLDLSNATSLVGFYFKNIQNTVNGGLFVRDGQAAYQLDGVALFTLRDCMAFNQRTRGYYSSAPSNVDIRFDNCVYYQTQGATWACTSAWDIAAGASFMLLDCEEIRSLAGSGNWLSYGINVTSAAATTWLFIVNSWFDAASDGTGANSANSAAMNLTSSAVNVRCTNSFFSAATSAGQKQRAVRINGGSDHQFVNCTFGGSGVEFATGNCTRMGITNCNFVQQFSDPCITFTGGAAPTLGTFANNTLQSPSSGIVGSAADAISFHNWTGGLTTDA